jgi:hypothetical protein
MDWLSRLSRRRRDDEITEEIESHLRMAIQDRMERGEEAEQARLAAQREFGNVALVTDATRRIWTSTTVETFLQDVRFGSHILWHSPGLSATAIILVALVIGGNTTIYSMVHGLLTSPASGVTAERLVCIGQISPDSSRFGPFTSYPNYLDYAAQSTTVRQLAAWLDERLTIGVGDGNYAVSGAPVTVGFFETFGVRIVKGRAFRDEDDRLEHAGLVAVISDRLWRERLENAADVVGRTIVINGRAATVVGVATPRFQGANLTPGEDVWLPITAFHEAVGSRKILSDRRQASILIAGQLAPGVSLRQAQSEFAALSAQLRAAYPDDNKDRRAVVFDYSVTAFLPGKPRVGRSGREQSRRRRGRPGPDRRDANDDVAARHRDRARAHGCDVVDVFRRRVAGRRSARPVRHHHLQHATAYARFRHPPGAGRVIAASPARSRSGGVSTHRDRSPDWFRSQRGRGCHFQARPVRGCANGSPHLHRRLHAAGGGGGAGILSARLARGPGECYRGVEAGMTHRLFRAQRRHRVEARRAPRRPDAGRHRHHDEERSD